ncbi:hypothetical protein TNCV_1066991 [Trichonephila clavipes]|uniref:Uncharacterized protein n=1 Tax=Trichonephila clavipes TaxID=2585209 RepID=A0A8X6R4J7_TRICX|nr:hypothetical protein TNCV_1066991 [Trichonephila clavipes]
MNDLRAANHDYHEANDLQAAENNHLHLMKYFYIRNPCRTKNPEKIIEPPADYKTLQSMVMCVKHVSQLNPVIPF